MTTRSCFWIICLAIVTLNLAGCQKGLHGKYVSLQQNVGTSGNMELGSAPSPEAPKPTLDFRRDGTVYLDTVVGPGQMAGTYTVEGNTVKISLGGGLEVHSGNISGNRIDTDFVGYEAVPGSTSLLTSTREVKLSFEKQ